MPVVGSVKEKVLGVVLVAAYRDGTGFDALRRLCSYGSGEESTAEAQYDYDASDSNRFAVPVSYTHLTLPTT